MSCASRAGCVGRGGEGRAGAGKGDRPARAHGGRVVGGRSLVGRGLRARRGAQVSWGAVQGGSSGVAEEFGFNSVGGRNV